MRGRPGPGALTGLAIGAALVAMLIWLPAALRGDYYEIGDPLLFMGVPIVVVSVAIGALIGVPPSRVPKGNGGHGGGGEQAVQPSRTSRALIALAAVAAASLAVLFFLSAAGAL